MLRRGGWGRERSLKVRGEEIYNQIVRKGVRQIGPRTTYLIRCVADANVEVGEIGFDHITQQNFQPLRFGLALHALGDFGGHARVEFDGDDLLGFFEDLDRQVSGAGAYFEDYLSSTISSTKTW